MNLEPEGRPGPTAADEDSLDRKAVRWRRPRGCAACRRPWLRRERERRARVHGPATVPRSRRGPEGSCRASGSPASRRGRPAPRLPRERGRLPRPAPGRRGLPAARPRLVPDQRNGGDTSRESSRSPSGRPRSCTAPRPWRRGSSQQLPSRRPRRATAPGGRCSIPRSRRRRRHSWLPGRACRGRRRFPPGPREFRHQDPGPGPPPHRAVPLPCRAGRSGRATCPAGRQAPRPSSKQGASRRRAGRSST